MIIDNRPVIGRGTGRRAVKKQRTLQSDRGHFGRPQYIFEVIGDGWFSAPYRIELVVSGAETGAVGEGRDAKSLV